MKEVKVIITLTEPMLGTTSGNVEVATEFIASRHPNGVQEDELEAMEESTVEEELENGSTVFPKEDGNPFMWDYQIKGFCKDACSMLRRVPGTKSKGLAAHKKIIDGLVFPQPRKIPIRLSGDLSWTERPLRAQTAQGERIALARSETAPAGSTMEFSVRLLNDALVDLLIEWLDYGELRGLGQWRNSGMGRFVYQHEVLS